MNRTFCRKADRLWGYGVGLRAARVRLGTGQCQGETPSQFLRLTIACKRPPIAYARSSLRLSAAPEAWRWAALWCYCGAEDKDHLRAKAGVVPWGPCLQRLATGWIAYEVHGTGPALLLLHGFSHDRCLWSKHGWIAHLQPAFTVLTMDMRGCGASDAHLPLLLIRWSNILRTSPQL